MTATLRPSDIATVPPIAKANEMEEAATLLKRWRKALDEGPLSVEWKKWLLNSLLAGLEPESE